MKSRRRINRRSRWTHVDLVARQAAADARREAIAATLPPAYSPPAPGEHWQRIVIDLYVPTCPARCDQHAVMIDGERVGMLSATELGATVRHRARKRPSVYLQAEIRRDEWREAVRLFRDP